MKKEMKSKQKLVQEGITNKILSSHGGYDGRKEKGK